MTSNKETIQVWSSPEKREQFITAMRPVNEELIRKLRDYIRYGDDDGHGPEMVKSCQETVDLWDLRQHQRSMRIALFEGEPS